MTMPNPVAALAATQRGYVARRQLLDLGMSHTAIDRRIRRGELRSVVAGVYNLYPTSDPYERLHAAVVALPQAVVSHQSAARLHGIRSFAHATDVVSVDASTTYRFPGVIVHRNRDLLPFDRTRSHDLPVTSLPRTVFDLAAVLTERRLNAVVDEVLGERRLTVSELDGLVRRLGKRGKPGTTAMREVLATRGEGPEANSSRLELLGLSVLEAAGLPKPCVEYSPLWNDRLSFDAAYPDQMLAIEWDSRRWHTAVDRFEHDRRRDRLAAVHGWLVLRYTWEDVTERASQVGREIGSVLRARS